MNKVQDRAAEAELPRVPCKGPGGCGSALRGETETGGEREMRRQRQGERQRETKRDRYRRRDRERDTERQRDKEGRQEGSPAQTLPQFQGWRVPWKGKGSRFRYISSFGD